MLTYLVLRLLALFAPCLPPWLGYRCAALCGELAFHLLPRVRRHVVANLNVVMPKPASAKSAARSVFRTGALNYFDLFRLPRLDLAQLDRLIETRGWDNIELARRQGKGVIVVTPHLGNLEVVGQLTVRRGMPCTIPTEHVRPRRLLDLVTRLRASQGITIVPLDGSAAPARSIYHALRRNEIVAIVADRDIQANGLAVPFFGRATALPSGPAVLALRSGAPVLAARSLRRGYDHFYVEVTEALDLPRSGNQKRDVQLGTELIARTLERFIHESPDQWVVFEPVWGDGLDANAGAPAGVAVGTTIRG